MKKIKIHYQFATAKGKTKNGLSEIKKRLRYINKNLDKNSICSLSIPESGPGSIETEFDEAIATPNVIQGIIDAEKNKFDVAIISCFSDPGLGGAREKVSIPVIGSGENSLLLASQLGKKISILSPVNENSDIFKNKIYKLGLEKKYCSTRSINTSVLSLARNKETTLDKLVKAGNKAIDDGADILILGCMSMAFHDLTQTIEKKLKIPVINPVKASLLMAESIVKMRLSHSKLAFPTPPNKTIY
ncbi:aspartate/glutamate racemase family protein [Alphaproteobacteria bacterium]|nr:aspartate/glutamate racemase family protein [Alphaproteobacteria bacterium]